MPIDGSGWGVALGSFSLTSGFEAGLDVAGVSVSRLRRRGVGVSPSVTTRLRRRRRGVEVVSSVEFTRLRSLTSGLGSTCWRLRLLVRRVGRSDSIGVDLGRVVGTSIGTGKGEPGILLG